MDNIRFLLLFGLVFIGFSLYQSWQHDYGQTQSVSVPQQAAPVDSSTEDIPTPNLVTDDNSIPAAPSNPAEVPTSFGQTSGSSKVTVKTDLIELEISALGGTVQSSWLQQYPLSLENQTDKFQLTDGNLPRYYVAQSGLQTNLSDKEAPTHKAVYKFEKTEYALADGENTLEVKMTWTDGQGINVTKVFTFTRGDYAISVRHIVDNQSNEDWKANEYLQFQRTRVGELGQNAFIYTYLGGAIYTGEDKYEKISFDNMQEKNLSKSTEGGWVSMIQHYFLGAWVPAAQQKNHFYTNALSDGRYSIGSQSPIKVIPAGQSYVFESQLVLGPKLQDELKAISPGLNLTVDYGFLTILAEPMFWLLQKIHDIVGNWGWAIIILTIMIKAVFFRLSAASYKSMANMRKMAPRLQALKERYGDDKQRMNQAMMDMYKKEKINPLGGCLPMLVQIPFFIALYWVLLESVELRQAPFMLWIQDLSIEDPFYILPLLMGVTMFAQQKLNPAPLDPMQAKIMMSLPIVFTVFFAFFPAGLVLYWFVNNLLSIAQQWYITKKIVDAE